MRGCIFCTTIIPQEHPTKSLSSSLTTNPTLRTRSQTSSGIAPVKRLEARSNNNSRSNRPISLGIVPVKVLFSRITNEEAAHSPNSLGSVPRKEFECSPKTAVCAGNGQLAKDRIQVGRTTEEQHSLNSTNWPISDGIDPSS